MTMYDNLTLEECLLLKYYRQCNTDGKDMVLHLAYSGVIVANENKKNYDTSVLPFKNNVSCGKMIDRE